MDSLGEPMSQEGGRGEDPRDEGLRICMVVSMLAPFGGIEAALATLAQRMGAAAAERYRCGDFDPASIARQHIEVYRFARGVSKARAIDLAA